MRTLVMFGLATTAALAVAASACDASAEAVDAASLDADGPDAGQLWGCVTFSTTECEEFGGGSCFELPTESTTVLSSAAPADWSCTLQDVTFSSSPITLTGEVHEFNHPDRVPNVTVSIHGASFESAPMVVATSNPDGMFSVVLPAGAPSRLRVVTTSASALDTYDSSASVDTTAATAHLSARSLTPYIAGALPAFVGVMRTPELGFATGRVLDCAGSPVAGAIATLSTTSSANQVCPTFVPQAQVYYFTNGSPSLPQRRSQPQDKATKGDGNFMLVEIPPTAVGSTYYLQIWGFRRAADVVLGEPGLTLLAEHAIPVPPGSGTWQDVLPTLMP